MNAGTSAGNRLIPVFAHDENTLRARIRWFLIGITAAVYWRVSSSGFINYDDAAFVSSNPHVYSGLTFANVVWAFTTLNGGASSYHPLTWLSHQLDCQLFGLHAGAHHLTNLWLHLANTVLLFSLLDKLTGKVWRSALVAALFALHPLHIESVAWISERKSLVCVFFWLLATLAYLRYTRERKVSSYLLVLLLYAAALLSKPIAVSLPLTLLLLDYWPLGRLRPARDMRQARAPVGFKEGGEEDEPIRLAVRLGLLILEKLPLLVLSGAICWVTVVAQADMGATASLAEVPLEVRLGNSVVAATFYLRKIIWPADLAPIYPLYYHWAWWQVAGCCAVLLLISLWALWHAGRRPYLLVGWCWYLVALFPTLGLVQVGSQGMADRYTYVPLIGIFLMLVWRASELIRLPRIAMAVGATGLVGACAASTFVTVGYWQGSLSLFRHATQVTDGNYIAYCQVGLALSSAGKFPEAESAFRQSLTINRKQALTERCLAEALFFHGDSQEAMQHYSLALKLRPADAQTHGSLAEFFMHSRDPHFHDSRKALEQARLACELSRYGNRDLLADLAQICAENHGFKEASSAARRALKLSVAPQEIQSATQLLADLKEKEATYIQEVIWAF
jgi:Flp pilus assembly protein TadD